MRPTGRVRSRPRWSRPWPPRRTRTPGRWWPECRDWSAHGDARAVRVRHGDRRVRRGWRPVRGGADPPAARRAAAPGALRPGGAPRAAPGGRRVRADGRQAWAARALGELRATRAHIPAPAVPTPPRISLSTLTPQERRVAEAVASGASDRQAAAELFLSPRTVAYHLSSVYRKLGISSRAALATRLAQARSGHPPRRSWAWRHNVGAAVDAPCRRAGLWRPGTRRGPLCQRPVDRVVVSGRDTVTWHPWPTAVSRSTLPPCSATIAATIDRPSPDPPSARERAASAR